jgi:Tfp pilus assembly protein FimT
MELLIVAAMVGIASSLAVGSFRRIQAKSLARASIEDLLVALGRTRGEAVAKDRRVGIAIGLDTTAGAKDASGVKRSGIRYLRYLDSDRGTVGAYDPADTVLQGWTTLAGKVFAYSIASSGLSAGTTNLVYRTDGSTDNDLSLVLGIGNFSDTFRLGLLPATGLATLER